MSLGKSNQRKKIAGQGRGALKSPPLPRTLPGLRIVVSELFRDLLRSLLVVTTSHSGKLKEFLHVASCSSYFQGQSSDVGW